MSFPHNATRVAISSYKNVDYDVKPAKMRFTSHENLLVLPLLLPVSSQREQTIVFSTCTLPDIHACIKAVAPLLNFCVLTSALCLSNVLVVFVSHIMVVYINPVHPLLV